jgi:hypothetical protein
MTKYGWAQCSVNHCMVNDTHDLAARSVQNERDAPKELVRGLPPRIVDVPAVADRCEEPAPVAQLEPDQYREKNPVA